jgi:hypothetical protein
MNYQQLGWSLRESYGQGNAFSKACDFALKLAVWYQVFVVQDKWLQPLHSAEARCAYIWWHETESQTHAGIPSCPGIHREAIVAWSVTAAQTGSRRW